jgi:hypothetical protein
MADFIASEVDDDPGDISGTESRYVSSTSRQAAEADLAAIEPVDLLRQRRGHLAQGKLSPLQAWLISNNFDVALANGLIHSMAQAGFDTESEMIQELAAMQSDGSLQNLVEAITRSQERVPSSTVSTPAGNVDERRGSVEVIHDDEDRSKEAGSAAMIAPAPAPDLGPAMVPVRESDRTVVANPMSNDTVSNDFTLDFTPDFTANPMPVEHMPTKMPPARRPSAPATTAVAMQSELPPQQVSTDWIKLWSEDHQRHFWRNRVTNQNSWQNPDEPSGLPPPMPTTTSREALGILGGKIKSSTKSGVASVAAATKTAQDKAKAKMNGSQIEAASAQQHSSALVGTQLEQSQPNADDQPTKHQSLSKKDVEVPQQEDLIMLCAAVCFTINIYKKFPDCLGHTDKGDCLCCKSAQQCKIVVQPTYQYEETSYSCFDFRLNKNGDGGDRMEDCCMQHYFWLCCFLFESRGYWSCEIPKTLCKGVTQILCCDARGALPCDDEMPMAVGCLTVYIMGGPKKKTSAPVPHQAPPTIQPHMQPHTTQPHMTQPHMTQPHVTQPHVTQPRMTQLHMMQPNAPPHTMATAIQR